MIHNMHSVEDIIYKRPVPLNKILKRGQQIKYSEWVQGGKDNRKTQVWRSGIVEFVSEYFAAVRNSRGIIYTFTATDVYTNDVAIEGYKKPASTLAEVLGLKEE